MRRPGASLEGGGLGSSLWWLGGALLLVAVGTELLPVVFGTGARARWDWSLTYVSLRFLLLPMVSLGHLLLVGVFLVARHRSAARVPAWPASSGAAPIAFLLGHWLYPLPWFV